jgi:hypothetical protein
MKLEDEWESRAWVAFAAAVLGGLWASEDGAGPHPAQIAAEQADAMLEEYRERRPR